MQKPSFVRGLLKKWCVLFGYSISSVAHLFEILCILEIDEDGVLFEEAFFEYAVDHVFFGEWSFFDQDLLDHIAHDARLVAPFSQCVVAAANEHEACVLDELIVSGCHMRLLAKGILDRLCHFAEVHRRAMLAHDKEGVVLDTARLDVL